MNTLSIVSEMSFSYVLASMTSECDASRLKKIKEIAKMHSI